jgi:2,3-bisphosphoglycerate-dependent phosphoglycerate mutase
VHPIARDRGLEVAVDPDLRERRLSPRVVMPTEEFLAQVRRSWDDPDYALPGGETAREATARGRPALDRIRGLHPLGTVVAGSHGGLIALLLNSIEECIELPAALAMPMPALFRLSHDGAGWHVVSGPGLAPRGPRGASPPAP